MGVCWGTVLSTEVLQGVTGQNMSVMESASQRSSYSMAMMDTVSLRTQHWGSTAESQHSSHESLDDSDCQPWPVPQASTCSGPDDDPPPPYISIHTRSHRKLTESHGKAGHNTRHRHSGCGHVPAVTTGCFYNVHQILGFLRICRLARHRAMKNSPRKARNTPIGTPIHSPCKKPSKKHPKLWISPNSEDVSRNKMDKLDHTVPIVTKPTIMKSTKPRKSKNCQADAEKLLSEPVKIGNVFLPINPIFWP